MTKYDIARVAFFLPLSLALVLSLALPLLIYAHVHEFIKQ